MTIEDEARAEAERYLDDQTQGGYLAWPESQIQDAMQDYQAGYIAGASRQPSEAEVEAAARALAQLAPGEPWPLRGALGGGPTGTRDDEYRESKRDEARDALEAARTARGEQHAD